MLYFIFSDTSYSLPTFHAFHYNSFNTFRLPLCLISGPTCGICALSMVFRGLPSAELLLECAKKHKFTNNGEMFSSKWLLNLLEMNIGTSSLNPKNVRSYIYDGELNSEFIQEKLKNHAMLLIPYDADRNHQPCQVNGHKAHWALVCGYLIDDDDEVSFALGSLTIKLKHFAILC